jgi:hypothetical protein
VTALKAWRLYRGLKPYLEMLEGKPMGTLLKNWKTTLAGLVGILTVVGPAMGWITHDQALSIGALAASFGLIAAKDSNVSGKPIIIVALLIAGAGLARAQQPVPDTFVSTGVVTNYQIPYHPAPYMAAGTLVNSSESQFPTYAGMRYELYVDATGKPAYAGMATVKVVMFHKNRFFCFADASVGGAGSVSSISSALQAGGGCGLQIGKYSATNTPHWEAFVEPQARRVPALANGTNPALLVGVSYTFNRPK